MSEPPFFTFFVWKKCKRIIKFVTYNKYYRDENKSKFSN